MKYSAAFLAFTVLSSPVIRAEEVKKEDGAAIYKRLCAECHGDFGEGRYGPATQVVDEWATDLIRKISL